MDGACGWKGAAKPDVFVGAADGYGEREVPGQGWEPAADQIRGTGILLQLWALGQGELGAGQGTCRYSRLEEH